MLNSSRLRKLFACIPVIALAASGNDASAQYSPARYTPRPQGHATYPPGTLPSVPCTLSLSGALTGSFSCTVSASFDPGQHRSAVVIRVSNPKPLSRIYSRLFRPPPITMATTWNCKASGMDGVVTAHDRADNAWITGPGRPGSCGVSIQSVRVVASSRRTKTYAIHGRLWATLLPEAPAANTVTMNATF